MQGEQAPCELLMQKLCFAFFLMCLTNLLLSHFSNLSEASTSLSYPLLFPSRSKWPTLSLSITFFSFCIYEMNWETSCTIPGKLDNKQDRNSCINIACIKHALVWSYLRVERQNYWEWPGLLPVASNAAEKAQTSHSGEVMQMQCSQRPQELWKDLCKYLMHSCALRFMETKTTVTEPMPHLLVPPPFCFFSTERL